MNYDVERRELFDWLISEHERIEKEYPHTGGRDGEGTTKTQLATREYNKKFLALKEKYQIK